jgi:hypothetical protein
MMSIKKYYLIILAILSLLLDLLSTYYCSGETLKYEGNPLFLKYRFGWNGLIFLLSAFCSIDILFFIYHKWIHKNVDYSKESPLYFTQIPMLYLFKSTTFEEFLTNIFHRGLGLQTLKSSFLSVLNYFGFYNIRIYIITHIPLVINNFLLGIIYNNATIDIDNIKASTTIHIHQSWLWDSFLGKIAIWYFSLGQEKNQLIMSYVYYLATALIFLMFIAIEYKKAMPYIVTKLRLWSIIRNF